MKKSRTHYGWAMVAVGFVVYGFGIGPAYYSWGFFAPEIISELGLSREQIGGIFGVFTLTYAVIGPLAGLVIRRVGLRITITCGALLAALGFWQVSRAVSISDFYLSYALIGGVGIGFSTMLPAQALPVYWFKRYRARATAIILLGAAVVGGMVTPVDDWILRHWDWRVGWQIIACVSAGVALVSAVFIRNRPEDLGLRRDGRQVDNDSASQEAKSEMQHEPPLRWTAWEAVRTPQFLVVTFAGLANVLPWRVMTAHGRLHFEDLGFTPTVAAALLGVRVGVSAFGRLSGSAGDFLAPTRVLAIALVINGLGVGGLVLAETQVVAYPCVVLLGVGYGAAYISGPVVLAYFFGRGAFVGTSGLRIAIAGVVGYLGPTLAGAAADRTGTYTGALVVLMGICFVGAAVIYPCRRPVYESALADRAALRSEM